MSRGFVNLNRYKNGRALKRNSKRRTAAQRNRRITRKEARFLAQGK